MKNKKLKILLGIIITFCVCVDMIFAAGTDDSESEEWDGTYDFWNEASNWYKPGSTDIYFNASVISDIAGIVEKIGTGVIAIATVVLGIKYLIGSVSDRASVKENMITLLIACIFFFGWTNIRGLIIRNITYDPNTENIAVSGISGDTQLFIFNGSSLESAFASVFSIIVLVAKFIAVIVTVYMGVKYIFSGPEVKAKLKEKSIMYIIGIIMIFTTLNILSFISTAINNSFIE